MTAPRPTIDLAEAMAHAPFLRRVARALVGDEQLAEDLLQDTWLSTLQSPPESRGRLREWLATVLRNKARNRHRHEVSRSDRELQSAQPEARESQESAARIEVQRKVFDHVLGLGEPHREVLYLRFYEGLRPAVIAERLELPVKTVKSRLHRALTALRERLDREHQGDRQYWMSALIPLGPESLRPLGPTPVLVAGITMKKLSLVILVLAISGAIALPRLLSWRETSAWQPASQPIGPAFVSYSQGTQTQEQDAVLPLNVERSRIEVGAPASERVVGDLEVSVRWDGGEGAAGIGVELEYSDPALSRPEVRISRTDTTGVVRFEQIPIGEARVRLDRVDQVQTTDVRAGAVARLDVRMELGHEVVGTVLDLNGKPVPHASIWIEPRSAQWSRFGLATRADAAGHYRLQGLGLEVRLGARAAGFLPSPVVRVREIASDANGRRTMDHRLHEGGGTLSGRVLAPDGRPVQGATVVAGSRGGSSMTLDSGMRAAHAPPVRVSTDEHGVFSYPGSLPNGVAPVSVTALGFPTWEGTAAIVEGVERDLEVQLTSAASIEGRLLDSDGNAVAGGQVMIAREERGGWFYHQVPPPQAITDESGRFALSGVGPGTHELNASASRKQRSLGKAQWSFECEAGDLLRVDLVLDQGRVIEGVVVDLDGSPVAGWAVRSRQDVWVQFGDLYGHSYPRDCATNAAGKFLLANLGEGVHSLLLQPQHYYGAPLARVPNVAANTQGLRIVVDTSQTPDASLLGTIAGIPSNATLTVQRRGAGRMNRADLDRQTGRFKYGPLVPGQYRLQVIQGSKSLFVGEFLEIQSGQQREVEMIALESPGAVELSVVGDLPASLEGWNVWAIRAGCSGVQLPLRNGIFTSDELAPGRWLLRLQEEPFFMADTWVDVVSGETLQLEGKVQHGRERNVICRFGSAVAEWSQLSVEITDDQGNMVRSYPALSSQWHGGPEVSLQYAFLPDGTYTLSARTDSGLEGEGTRTMDGPSREEDPWIVDLR